MATEEQLSRALMNADAAGDTQAAQALANEIRRMRASAPAAKPERSAVSDFVSGAGIGMRDLAVGAKQRLDEAAAALQRGVSGTAVGRGIDNLNSALGLSTPQDILSATNATVASNREADAPVMSTTAGKVGNVVGTAIPAAVASFIPGGASLTGSAITGGVFGAAQPTVGDESVARNVALGAGGGVAGYGIGKGIAAGAQKLVDGKAASATLNAGRDAVAQEARQAGYVIPPSQANPSFLNQTLEGFAGKISTGQKASVKNQKLTNILAARAVGLPEGAPITGEALDALRGQYGQAYSAVAGRGAIDATGASLPKSVSASSGLDPLTLTPKTTVDAAEVVRAWKQANADATAWFRAAGRSANPEDLAKARTNAAAAKQISDFIDAKFPDLAPQLKDARVGIAKAHTVENALNASTGDVSAPALAKMLEKGKPLSGELKQIAQFGQAFPKAAQNINSSALSTSPLDFALALGTSNPLMLLTRPATRMAILSEPYQRMMTNPSYSSPLARMLAGAPLPQLGVASGTALPNLSQ